MSLSVTYDSTVTVEETLTGNAPFATSAKKKVTHDQFDTSTTLNAGSTPPATTFAAFQKALSSGTATIDLTSVTGTNGATVNFTGLKLQLVKIRNPATNANGSSKTFDLTGTAAQELDVYLVGG